MVMCRRRGHRRERRADPPSDPTATAQPTDSMIQFVEGDMFGTTHLAVPALTILAICIPAGPLAADAKDSAQRPDDAKVLFAGKDLSGWVRTNGGFFGSRPAPWKVADGYMEVVPGRGDIITK